MPSKPEPAGCRSAAIATSLFVGTAVVSMVIGLTLINDADCAGGCETLALTLFYAGLPISAVFGVVFGDLVVAWPLDMTFWVVAGFLLAKFSDNRRRSVLGATALGIAIALIYGLVLSQFVEMAI